jgi:hypothetical protein
MSDQYKISSQGSILGARRRSRTNREGNKMRLSIQWACAFLILLPSTAWSQGAEELFVSIDSMAEFALQYAIALAAIGTLSMALLEAFKKVSNWRERYHMRAVHRWIRGTPFPADANVRLGNPVDDADFHRKAYGQLLELTTGEAVLQGKLKDAFEDLSVSKFSMSLPRNALFSLELEKLLGQVDSAAEVVLNAPTVYPDLFLLLVSGADPEDIALWWEASRAPQSRFVEDKEWARVRTDAFGRLQQRIRRRLDAAQLTTGWYWARSNQLASLIIGAVLLFIALYLMAPPHDPETWGMNVVASVLGGLVAPVAKDIVVALQKVRSRG